MEGEAARSEGVRQVHAKMRTGRSVMQAGFTDVRVAIAERDFRKLVALHVLHPEPLQSKAKQSKDRRPAPAHCEPPLVRHAPLIA